MKRTTAIRACIGDRSVSLDAPSRPRAANLWRWPVALAVLTATGLVSALVSDTWGDVWSWVALGLPVAVMTIFSFRRSPPR